MAGFSKKLLAAVILPFFLMAVFSTTALSEDDREIPENITAHAMAWDAFVVRPVGVVSIGIGSVIFGITWPLAALGGNTDVTFEKLIAEPVSFTFRRQLGDF
jgi:hypothetical protein